MFKWSNFTKGSNLCDRPDRKIFFQTIFSSSTLSYDIIYKMRGHSKARLLTRRWEPQPLPPVTSYVTSQTRASHFHWGSAARLHGSAVNPARSIDTIGITRPRVGQQSEASSPPTHTHTLSDTHNPYESLLRKQLPLGAANCSSYYNPSQQDGQQPAAAWLFSIQGRGLRHSRLIHGIHGESHLMTR